MAAWKLPLVVSTIALPIVASFYVGGPGLGMAVGALAAATIIVLAVRKPPLGKIAIAAAPDTRQRLLVVLGSPLEDAGAEAMTRIEGALAAGASPEVLLIAPCRSRFAERWTSDLEPGKKRARAELSRAASTLGEVGIAVSTRVGDEDTVQMSEDVLREFPATEVVLIEDEARTRTADELRARLAVPFHAIGVVKGKRGRDRFLARPVGVHEQHRSAKAALRTQLQ